MAYVIDQNECVGCGTCMDECEENAIVLESDDIYIIIPSLCNDCGACAYVCPMQAISKASKSKIGAKDATGTGGG